MTFEQSLDYFNFLAFVGVEVVVLFNTLSAWRLLRHRFLAFLCIGAALGLYVTVTDYTLGRNPASQNDYYWYWVARQVVSIASMLFYGAGIFFMVRFLLGLRPETPASLPVSPSDRNA